ncbi:caspase domain-containing protein [Whalleya microplaca]|nr:caspase domain-containing protein [Whalleya microplaca]
MADNGPMTTHWAIVIGIDYYTSDRCLRGSVRDAVMVQHHLEEGNEPVDIRILTATTPSNKSARRPVEEPKLWPTCTNVISGLMRVLELANPGDSVYLHYSGHGVRIPSDVQSESGNTEELALVLFENDEIGSRYLRGAHLASALRKMVDKGLIVTVVLDCCFSGSVKRLGDWQDGQMRCIDYSANVDNASTQLDDVGLWSEESTFRNSEIEKTWLINPDGYIILSAAGPYENAYEVDIEGHGRNGALTYLLLHTLRILGGNGVLTTHLCLHEYLSAKFHALWPQQTPMRYGNKDRLFFGKFIIKPEAAYVSIYTSDNDRLYLRAGEVHGISKGDEFTVLPFVNVPEWTTKNPNEPPRVLRVEAVRPFDSDLVEIRAASTGRQITTGWKATLTKCASPRKIRARLAEDIDNKSQWVEGAQDRHFLHLAAEEDDGLCIFNVKVNKQEEFEVLDALDGKIPGLPTIPVDSTLAIPRTLDLLQHLATFKYFEGVENRLPCLSFQESFSIIPHSTINMKGIFDIPHGDIWGFTIVNTLQAPLYMAIFNFRPLWEIANMVSCSGGDSYLVVPPKEGTTSGRKEVKLRMNIPHLLRNSGITQCEDIVKVFITNSPVAFPTIILPEIQHDGSRNEQSCGTKDLLVFLSNLPTQDTRGQDNDRRGQWSTYNFIIQTTL